ncbi:hypothetical protein [Paenibacillus marinisediminis]
MLNYNVKDEATKIGIGIIGTPPMLERVTGALRAFPTFRPEMELAEDIHEAIQHAERLMEHNEVLLILEADWLAPIQMVTKSAIPVHGITLTDTGFVQALFQMRHVLDAGEIISIDVKEQSKLKRRLKELEVDEDQFHVLSGVTDGEMSTKVTAQATADAHIALYEAGKVQAAITSDYAVSRQLEKKAIPHAVLAPTEANLVVALERALLSTESRKSKEAQIAVGLIHVDKMDQVLAKLGSEHEVQRLRLELYRHLLDYVVSLDGSMSHLGGAEYLFFTTRGIFERQTHGYKVLGLAPELFRDLGITLSVGIGFGRSANESGTHARQALHVAQSAGGNGCYIVREDRTIVGPLEMTMPLEATISLADVELMAAANEAGMNSVYLSKLIAHVSRKGHLDMDVHELAFILSITIRSAHRLLVQWMDANLVSIVGSEKVERGRPKNIYRFSFLHDAMR